MRADSTIQERVGASLPAAAGVVPATRRARGGVRGSGRWPLRAAPGARAQAGPRRPARSGSPSRPDGSARDRAPRTARARRTRWGRPGATWPSSSSYGEHAGVAPAAAAAKRVLLEFGGEDAQCGLEETCRAVGMAARAAAADLARPAHELSKPLAACPASGQLLDRPRDRVEPVYARAALPGALACQVAEDTRAFRDRACARRQRDDRTGPERLRRDAHPRRVGRGDPAAEVTADEECRDLLGQAAEVRDQLSEGGPQLDLVHAGLLDGAAECDERRAGGIRSPRRPEPAGAEARDECDVRERLDVLHERRRSVEPALERIRRLQRGLGLAALERAQEGRLLAGDERRRHGGERDVGVVASTPLGERSRQAAGGRPVRHRDDDSPCADRAGGDHRAVEHEVRREPADGTVLRARRLALGGVGDHDWTPPRRGDGAQLGRRRERRAPAAAQARAVELFDQSRGSRQRPERGRVLGKRKRAVAVDVGEQARQNTRRGGRDGCDAHAVDTVPETLPDAVSIESEKSSLSRWPLASRTLAPTSVPASDTIRPVYTAPVVAGTNETPPAVICTPSPLGMPRSSMRAAPRGESESCSEIATVASPSPPMSVETDPPTADVNDVGGFGIVALTTRTRFRARIEAGVPARRAHPCRTGPPWSQTRRTSGTATAAAAPPTRAARAPSPSATRARTAAATNRRQPMPSACSQPVCASLPVPSECTNAIGHAAYASQCNPRHTRAGIEPRIRLVATSARRRSKETAPSPSHSGRYGDRNGTTASSSPIGA